MQTVVVCTHAVLKKMNYNEEIIKLKKEVNELDSCNHYGRGHGKWEAPYPEVEDAKGS